jgi:hypothetical protein
MPKSWARHSSTSDAGDRNSPGASTPRPRSSRLAVSPRSATARTGVGSRALRPPSPGRWIHQAGWLQVLDGDIDLDRKVVVLGLVLGPLVEKNFRLSPIISRGNPAVFFSTWIDDLLWLLLIVFFVGPLLIRAMAHLRPVRPAQPGPTTC